MVKSAELLYYLVHPRQARAIIQWLTWHHPVHERTLDKESASLKRCFYFLDQTSRSFSAVIQELHPELLVPIALFYLILRGLDTIEDDMTIPLPTKEPLLRGFRQIIDQHGWNFDGNGPDEEDRQLLVEFNVVIEQFALVKPAYRSIIADITNKMGNGMADYASNAEHNDVGVASIQDYDLYCHYVAGLVGEGLTRLFVESQLANPILRERTYLHESMGLFLQKTNIIRDIHEDFEDHRAFWPKEIWSQYVDTLDDLFKPENQEAALNCSSAMVLNALDHVEDCLLYLAGLKEQSVFNFATIPQTMAIATLALVFRNPDIFKKNVKITKGSACEIMISSTQNLQVASGVFRKYMRQLHQKNNPRDPNFLKISIACGRIEQFIESKFPTPRPQSTSTKLTPEQKAAESEELWTTSRMLGILWHLLMRLVYVMLAMAAMIVVITILMIGVGYLLGARFDVMFSELWKGHLSRPDASEVENLIETYDGRQRVEHAEL